MSTPHSRSNRDPNIINGNNYNYDYDQPSGNIAQSNYSYDQQGNYPPENTGGYPQGSTYTPSRGETNAYPQGCTAYGGVNSSPAYQRSSRSSFLNNKGVRTYSTLLIHAAVFLMVVASISASAIMKKNLSLDREYTQFMETAVEVTATAVESKEDTEKTINRYTDAYDQEQTEIIYTTIYHVKYDYEYNGSGYSQTLKSYSNVEYGRTKTLYIDPNDPVHAMEKRSVTPEYVYVVPCTLITIICAIIAIGLEIIWIKFIFKRR